MHMQCHILFPFDLGLELDFTGKDAQEMFKDLSTHKTTNLYFEDEIYPGAEVATQIYKFGTGMVQITFHLEGDITQAARLSCFSEKIYVGKTPIAVGLLEDALAEIAREKERIGPISSQRSEESDMANA